MATLSKDTTGLPLNYRKKIRGSRHDLSTVRRTTAHPGMIIPIYSRKMMPNDRFDIRLRDLIKSEPLVQQLYGSFRVKFGVFFDSDANYYQWLDNNNTATTESLLEKKRHHMYFSKMGLPKISTEPGSAQGAERDWSDGIPPTSMDCYAGLPGGFMFIDNYDDGGTITVNNDAAIDVGFYLTYLNIIRNYYLNTQEEIFPITKFDTKTKTYSPYYVTRVMLDSLFAELRLLRDGADLSTLSNEAYPGIYWFAHTYIPSCATVHGGFCCDTFQNDLMRNLLSLNTGKVQSFVQTGSSGFTIDTLRFRNKLQRLIDRYDISGGRASDVLRTVWGVKTRRDLDIPEWMGAHQNIMSPDGVVSTAATETDALGSFGGNFNSGSTARPVSIHATVPGRVMILMSIVPEVDYVQGIPDELMEVYDADEYKPEFAQLGFQAVPLRRYSAFPLSVNGGTYVTTDTSEDGMNAAVGKQVAWQQYMTDVNRNFGEFGNGGKFEYWVLNRHYCSVSPFGSGVDDWDRWNRISQYVNPLEFQYPFQYQSILDANFKVQVALDIRAFRAIGERYMPTIE